MSKIHTSGTLCSSWKRAASVVILLILVLATPAVAGTASLTVAWNASSDPSVDGYIIEWGHHSGAYTDEVEVGVDVTSYTINGLVDGRRYYIIVRSTAAGVASVPSNEVSGVATAPPPTPEPDPDPTPDPDPDPTPDPEGDPTPDPEPDPNLEPDPEPAPAGLRVLDFDADSMDDLGVYRPSRGEWHVRGSSGLELFVDDGENRGANVVPMSADFDGDGTPDIASWNPSNGKWVVYASGNGFRRTSSSRFGSDVSIPVPADYDGDAEIAVFEPDGRWRIDGQENRRLGKRGDIPVPSDYDGDGAVDTAVFRPFNGRWYVSGQVQTHFGAAGDVPVPADYNGDGKVDLAVYRPSTSTWYVRDQFRVTFGEPGDEPVAMDTDGDGRAEIVVHRPSDGAWFLFDPKTGASSQIRYGEPGDVPIGVAPFRVLASGSENDPAPPDADSEVGSDPESCGGPETSPETSSDTGPGAGSGVDWMGRGRWPTTGIQ